MKHTTEYTMKKELAGLIEDVAKRVKRGVAMFLPDDVMLMPHLEWQRVVRQLAMSGVGDDLYDHKAHRAHWSMWLSVHCRPIRSGMIRTNAMIVWGL